MTRRWVAGAAKYGLAFGLLAVVLVLSWDPSGGRGLKAVWQAHVIEGKPAHGSYLLAAIGLIGVSAGAAQTRWYLLVRAQGLPVTYPAAVRLWWVGYIFNTLLPGSVGGDVVKAAALGREQQRRTAAVATVVMDRLIGLWALILFVAVVGGCAWAAGLLEGAGPARVVVVIAAGLIGCSLPPLVLLKCISPDRAAGWVGRVGRLKYIGRPAAGLLGAALLYRNHARCLGQVVGLCWVHQAATVLMFLCCVHALWDGSLHNPLPSPALHLLIVPIAQLVAALPLFPGGAGIGEAGYGGLYALFGSAPANGVLGSLVQRGLGLAVAAIGLVVYLAFGSGARDPEPQASPVRFQEVSWASGGR